MAAAAAYPPPPPYYRLYEKFHKDKNSAPSPPPPISGPYHLFGAEYTTEDVLPGLEEQGVRQLYPRLEDPSQLDVKGELQALGREVLLEFLELTDTLVQRPSQFARRVEEIGLLFKNIHHLLNSLRPHQARTTLIHLLEVQVQQRKQAAEDIRQRREEARELTAAAASDLRHAMERIEKAQLPEEVMASEMEAQLVFGPAGQEEGGGMGSGDDFAPLANIDSLMEDATPSTGEGQP
eukprot:TRINITY_DN37426_c0_g1_i1.p1 TRINITY_DN37426_c0_g1~~TRINITY_DN37426_c0_g1_i1.p1  ORF type:complete len:236 (+),score=66.69 TRINITY_DN37426_c0_g1_i1:203-910(+)